MKNRITELYLFMKEFFLAAIVFIAYHEYEIAKMILATMCIIYLEDLEYFASLSASILKNRTFVKSSIFVKYYIFNGLMMWHVYILLCEGVIDLVEYGYFEITTIGVVFYNTAIYYEHYTNRQDLSDLLERTIKLNLYVLVNFVYFIYVVYT